MLGGIELVEAQIGMLPAWVEDRERARFRQILEIALPGELRLFELVHEAARADGMGYIARQNGVRTIDVRFERLAIPGIVIMDAKVPPPSIAM